MDALGLNWKINEDKRQISQINDVNQDYIDVITEHYSQRLRSYSAYFPGCLQTETTFEKSVEDSRN